MDYIYFIIRITDRLYRKDVQPPLSPNVIKMITRFNEVSNWVQTEILTELRPKYRLKLVEKFVDIADHLLQMNNLNGAFEISSALESAAIARLKSTLNQMSSNRIALWQKAKELIDMKNLREAIRNATPPCLPYLGMYLTELTQIDEGNKNKTSDG